MPKTPRRQNRPKTTQTPLRKKRSSTDGQAATRISLQFAPKARLAVLAVGSPLRGDDAAGLLTAQKLKLLAARSRGRVRIFVGETAPENLTGEIKQFKPDHLLVIDAMDRKSRPGTLHVMDLHETELASLGPASTHNLPLGVLLKYLQACLSCRITLLGIQPKAIQFNGPVSKAVATAATKAARLITLAAS